MPEWLGVLFSHIGGNLNLTNIWSTDPDDDGNAAVSVVVNTIGKNLNCQNLGPRLTGGAIPGEFNIVGHKTTGQCVGLLSGFWSPTSFTWSVLPPALRVADRRCVSPATSRPRP